MTNNHAYFPHHLYKRAQKIPNGKIRDFLCILCGCISEGG
nr:MAG TPA: hypothetical protein [Bacteriophage sp.]